MNSKPLISVKINPTIYQHSIGNVHANKIKSNLICHVYKIFLFTMKEEKFISYCCGVTHIRIVITQDYNVYILYMYILASENRQLKYINWKMSNVECKVHSKLLFKTILLKSNPLSINHY